jgi:hypothetical protein
MLQLATNANAFDLPLIQAPGPAISAGWLAESQIEENLNQFGTHDACLAFALPMMTMTESR